MRYLDFQKLEWLVQDGGLFFGAAENQSDKSEGVYDHKFLSALLADNEEGINLQDLDGLDDVQLGLQQVGRSNNYLSCWYLDSIESVEMWDEYAKDGVVILSDDWTLRDALPEPLEQAISYYDVIYSDELKKSGHRDPLRFKNKKYHKEKEFRLVFDLIKYSILTGFEAKIEVRSGGILTHESSEFTQCMSAKGRAQSHKVLSRKALGFIFHYPLNLIIKEVRLHPRASDERLQVVTQLLRNAGIACPVNHSLLRSSI